MTSMWSILSHFGPLKTKAVYFYVIQLEISSIYTCLTRVVFFCVLVNSKCFEYACCLAYFLDLCVTDSRFRRETTLSTRLQVSFWVYWNISFYKISFMSQSQRVFWKVLTVDNDVMMSPSFACETLIFFRIKHDRKLVGTPEQLVE
jgi:hypothetical protein